MTKDECRIEEFYLFPCVKHQPLIKKTGCSDTTILGTLGILVQFRHFTLTLQRGGISIKLSETNLEFILKGE